MIHTHPRLGEILKEKVFEPIELSVIEAAERLAMSRELNAKADIGPDPALRLEKSGVGTARFWINQTANVNP